MRATKKPTMPSSSSAPENRPAQLSRLGLRLSRSPKKRPTASSTPTQSVAPMPSKNRNGAKSMPFWPATGGASIPRPGTNLANISITPRRRPNESWVRRTQVVGSSDSLHSRRSTWCPCLRPIRNHVLSALSAAATAARRPAESGSARRPTALRQPAAPA